MYDAAFATVAKCMAHYMEEWSKVVGEISVVGGKVGSFTSASKTRFSFSPNNTNTRIGKGQMSSASYDYGKIDGPKTMTYGI